MPFELVVFDLGKRLFYPNDVKEVILLSRKVFSS